MRLDGKVAGPWVHECDRVWHELQMNHHSKRFCLDLRNVTFVDDRGTALLRKIHQMSGAEVLVDSPLTQYFAERIMRKIEHSEKKGA